MISNVLIKNKLVLENIAELIGLKSISEDAPIEIFPRGDQIIIQTSSVNGFISAPIEVEQHRKHIKPYIKFKK
jgi:hypothetical protein